MRESLQVRALQASDVADWNRFVEQSPGATFFHRAEWKSIFEQTLGHTGHYLIAGQNGTIKGILPMLHMRSRLFGNMLTSLPFLAYGGVVSDSDEAKQQLLMAARQKAEQLGVDFIEYRVREKLNPDWTTKEGYVTFRKEIPGTPDECLLMIPRKQRAMVRKGIKNELTATVESNLDNFYPVFSESYRNLGTPVLSRRYFEAISEQFGDDCEVMTISKDSAPVASVMSFYFRDEVIPYYGGSVFAARSLMANDFMYWELMRRSCEAGIKIFDYGRSREGTGSYNFKKHWGFEPEPLHFQYELVGIDQPPDLSPANPKYKLAIAIWKKLPTRLTQVIGPILARGLPG